MIRKLILTAAASATFGAAIGVLAEGAAQSAASPQAIAAAVQRVQDTQAERTLVSIERNVWSICKDTPGTFAKSRGSGLGCTSIP